MSEFNLEDYDFGFSGVSDEDIKNQSEEDKYRDKLMKLHAAIKPLLKNLAKDADKNPYLHWPNRAEKIKEFTKLIDGIVND